MKSGISGIYERRGLYMVYSYQKELGAIVRYISKDYWKCIDFYLGLLAMRAKRIEMGIRD